MEWVDGARLTSLTCDPTDEARSRYPLTPPYIPLHLLTPPYTPLHPLHPRTSPHPPTPTPHTPLAPPQACDIDKASYIIDTLVQCTLRQMLQNGFFHADPHMGNLLVNAKGAPHRRTAPPPHRCTAAPPTSTAAHCGASRRRLRPRATHPPPPLAIWHASSPILIYPDPTLIPPSPPPSTPPSPSP